MKHYRVKFDMSFPDGSTVTSTTFVQTEEQFSENNLGPLYKYLYNYYKKFDGLENGFIQIIEIENEVSSWKSTFKK